MDSTPQSKVSFLKIYQFLASDLWPLRLFLIQLVNSSFVVLSQSSVICPQLSSENYFNPFVVFIWLHFPEFRAILPQQPNLCLFGTFFLHLHWSNQSLHKPIRGLCHFNPAFFGFLSLFQDWRFLQHETYFYQLNLVGRLNKGKVSTLSLFHVNIPFSYICFSNI